MKTLARWCARWRIAVVTGWVVALIGLAVAVLGLGTAFADSVTLPDSESTTAYSLLAEQSGAAGDTVTGNVVWHTDGEPITDPAVQQDATAMLAEVANQPGVIAVASPYDAAAGSQLNAEQNTAYATVVLAKDADPESVVAAAETLTSSTVDVQLGGAAFTEQPGGSHVTEGLGIVVALLILLLMFRSVWAAVLPILTGVTGVAASLLAVMLGSHVVDLAATSLTMGALIGLGVGIDYALFVVNRFRKVVVTGASTPDAIVTALNTSGRAVIFAGLTVVIALVGMVVVNLGILTGMAMAAALTVLVTMAAAISLLPALLAILGHRVLSRKQRAALADATVPEQNSPCRPSRTARWAGVLQRAPRRVVAAALLLILALAAPVLSMRVGDSDASSDPAGSPTNDYDNLMADGFGDGFDATLLVVAQTPDQASAQAFAALTANLSSVPDVASVTAAPVQLGQPVALATVVPATSAQTTETADLVALLRDGLIPAGEAGTNLQVYIGGAAATSIDISDALMNKLPLYLGLIALLGFLLLAVAFRSVLVPLVGAVSNVATIFVGLGAITAIFQFGWGSGLLGVGSGAPVTYLVPVLIVGVMFGLSMDYQVFLASRVHEEWTHTRDNARAVRVGVTETAPVIAAAALIMLSVFASFGLSGERIVSQIGIGLAVAVIVDAFVVRLALVPAVMNLLGSRNWVYPRWADRITPRLSIEGPAEIPSNTPALVSTAASTPAVATTQLEHEGRVVAGSEQG